MLTAESIYEFYINSFRLQEGRVSVEEHGDYFLLSFINTRHKLTFQTSSTVLLYTARLYKFAPRNSRRIRDIVAIHKQWGSIDAMCILYARRMYQRLLCSGRPEAVSTIVRRYKPDILTTITWNPIILDECKDKEILMYYTPMKTKTYICRLGEKKSYNTLSDGKVYFP